MGERADGGFSSAGVVALAIRVLRDTDPRLLPAAVAEADPLSQARYPAADKRAILDHAFRRGGAGPILAIGKALDPTSDNPTLAALLKSADPDILAAKWMRLERYHHARNRTRIAMDGGSAWTCARYATGGPAPSPAENLLIGGLLVGLLGLAGAKAVTFEIGGARFDAARLGAVRLVEAGGTDAFRIAWEGFRPAAGPTPATDGTGSAADRLKALIRQDASRRWRVADAARALHLSSRTLQRTLAVDRRTFSTVVREARVSEAGRMLRETATPLAEIGYCCGYADQAHFQRDIARVLNMTPTEYRRIAQA